MLFIFIPNSHQKTSSRHEKSKFAALIGAEFRTSFWWVRWSAPAGRPPSGSAACNSSSRPNCWGGPRDGLVLGSFKEKSGTVGDVDYITFYYFFKDWFCMVLLNFYILFQSDCAWLFEVAKVFLVMALSHQPDCLLGRKYRNKYMVCSLCWGSWDVPQRFAGQSCGFKSGEWSTIRHCSGRVLRGPTCLPDSGISRGYICHTLKTCHMLSNPEVITISHKEYIRFLDKLDNSHVYLWMVGSFAHPQWWLNRWHVI